LREHGDRYPAIGRLVSVWDGERVRPPSPAGVDFAKERALFTFDGLVSGTPFVTQMRSLLRVLSDATGGPVDVEFASDGRDLYVVQCRPQSSREEAAPTPIPRDLPDEKILFTARRYISNGRVPDVTHIVYVDPEGYAGIGDADALHQIARAVGKMNRLLPKRQFVLMGPGRWGSRGDIRLGVPVTYADINNTAALIEIARRRGNYVPDLSFGTHFFQDLVEAGIRYIPLYPDDPGVRFNAPFFRGSPSIAADLVPDLAHLADVLRVIDLARAAPGQVLRILMNGEIQEAVGLLASPESQEASSPSRAAGPAERPSDDHWRWRLRFAQTIASALNPKRFGVKGLYLFGSTKNATAGPASDIDLIVHFSGTSETQRSLEEWLEGWSLSLAEMNFLRTGYRTEGGLLDVHIVTDADIASQTSYAAKIGAVTDAARPLPLGVAAP
jgi:pyruvate, water dikinase